MSTAQNANPTTSDGTGLIAHDPWLEPYRDRLRDRYSHYTYIAGKIAEAGGLLGQVSQGHHYFGLNRGEKDGVAGVWYREWAPAAYALFLTGDFNGWDRRSHPLARDEFGTWAIFLPDSTYAERLVHTGLLKVHVVSQTGPMDRIPAYIRRVVQDPQTHGFIGQYWNPPAAYAWQYESPKPHGGLRIYEAHVGMATEEHRVGTYDEFTANILPRVKRLGYNAIQLMAVMEHPYYGSFGYHVSNFFAVSSRCGTPEELKRLIDTAHGMGIRVLLDVVHSHSVKNTNEGLSQFDGTDYHYFHAGPRGQHIAWDSLLFDYRKFEVQRFLLSNLRYWLEEFRFDGFRFDGVTSMLYLDHGLGRPFNGYEDYFGGNVDWDAVVYLQLANELVHQLKPDAVTIAEDVSGMAGMGRPVSEGGLGFDYRLAMGIPDNWIKVLKEKKDEEWDLRGIYHTLTDRRHAEKHVAYVESHDQALVGDKTLAFQLMDQEMYWNMSKFNQSLVVDRGIALHKMIRLITFSLGGEAYLTFMGNEFGHPEWVDFPREGNGYSYQYARRQWSLSARDDLRYAGLELFDKEMLALDENWNLLNDPFIEQLDVREDYRLLVYRRGPLVFVFNFHATESYTDLRIPVPDPVDYRLVLDTDESRFGGFGRVAADVTYYKQDIPLYTRDQSIQIYIPARTAQVLAPKR
ncbi:alpha-amylase family glycosyl hydrolase [Humisphaera borealis]|uniref:1,4-alpha-glucan branching enzyme n=1 Tax=Humisphaera borealis TaxID=2807512 RepID=A0A7M2WRZ0_9BACT|nr:alpha-amylase family glycosyl hydrolase [Humisphaera borealis]QOV88287.1 alpha amylase C-terminal domain-containing protein [Humisphaera borealis]